MAGRTQRVWTIGGTRPRAIQRRLEPEVTVEVHWTGGRMSVHGSPGDLDAFAAGYLVSEGIVASFEDIRSIRVRPTRGRLTRVDVRLRHPTPAEGLRRDNVFVGATEETRARRRVESRSRVQPDELLALAAALRREERHLRAAGHLHWGAVWDSPEGAMLLAADISRHSALDKAIGKALLTGRLVADRILYSTGRLGEEMAAKAVRVGAAALATRSVAFAPAAELAQRQGLLLVGKLHPGGFWVYAGRERLASMSGKARR